MRGESFRSAHLKNEVSKLHLKNVKRQRNRKRTGYPPKNPDAILHMPYLYVYVFTFLFTVIRSAYDTRTHTRLSDSPMLLPMDRVPR